MVEEKVIHKKTETDSIYKNEEIFDFVENRKQQQIKILSNLITENTVNPPGNEIKAAKVIIKHLKKLKIKYKTFEKEKHRTNLVAYLNSKNKNAKTILIANHLDTVPAGDGWDTKPFKAIIKDNLLYGRGACDNKGQAAASLLVLEYLKSKEKELKNNFIFIFGADEETGSRLGMKYLLSRKLIHADYAIVPDVSGEMKLIDVAEKGILNIKITSIGKQSHGAYPHKGISAITNMSKLITKLDYYNLKCDIHPYLSKPTINFGTITGGSAPNTVAARCDLLVNIRYLPSQTEEGILAELKTLGERFGEFNFEVLMNVAPSEVDDNNILVTTIQNVSKKYGLNPKPHGLNGATNAKDLVLNGIAAVGFDFGDNYIPHNANEYCNLDNLFKFCNILIEVCLELDSNEKL